MTARRLTLYADLLNLAALVREERDEVIRALVRQGEPVARIAEEAGLSRAMVYKIAGDLLDYDAAWHATRDGDR